MVRGAVPVVFFTLQALACAALALAGCASGGDGPPGVGDFGITDDRGSPRDLPGFVDGAPPDLWALGDQLPPPPDLPPSPDAAPDAAPSCPDQYEGNETCAAGAPVGPVQQEAGWTSITATSSPAGDVDWYTIEGKEKAHTCVPFTGECLELKVRITVPAGRRLKACLMEKSCSGDVSCDDNSTTPGPAELNVSYTVSGTCALNDDTTGHLWVEQLDVIDDCAPYTLDVRYDGC